MSQSKIYICILSFAQLNVYIQVKRNTKYIIILYNKPTSTFSVVVTLKLTVL